MNLYKADKEAKKRGIGSKRWSWIEVSVEEIKCWLGIVIYMGAVSLPAVQDFWRHDGLFPAHDFTSHMTLMRFEDIKESLHISPPHETSLDHDGRQLWHAKVEVLLQQVQFASQKYWVSSSNISIDEAIIWCT